MPGLTTAFEASLTSASTSLDNLTVGLALGLTGTPSAQIIFKNRCKRGVS
jgi:putative Mn2+ efflux pump MntP